jgi:hypothetical protein
VWVAVCVQCIGCVGPSNEACFADTHVCVCAYVFVCVSLCLCLCLCVCVCVQLTMGFYQWVTISVGTLLHPGVPNLGPMCP